MGTSYPWCSRVIEVESRRTPVGVYTLMECSSDLMRRATISRSRSRSRNRIHRDSSSISHLTVLAEFSIISDYHAHSLHRKIWFLFQVSDRLYTGYKCMYWIIFLPSFWLWTFFSCSRQGIRRATGVLMRFRGEKILRGWWFLSW